MIEIRHEHIIMPDDEIRAYDGIYQTAGIRQLDSFYLWVLSLLHPRPGQTLLDVSTGEGSLIHFARQLGLRAYGIDFSAVALRKGKADYELEAVSVSNAERLPLRDDSFDLVTNIGSLEHYFDPETAVREMSRVLSPAGVACILVPNAFSLFGNVQYVCKTGDVYDDGQPLQRYNTRAGWQRLLVDNGLAPFRIVKYELERPRTLQDGLWYLRRPSKLVRLLISPLIPVNLANSIVYLCHVVT